MATDLDEMFGKYEARKRSAESAHRQEQKEAAERRKAVLNVLYSQVLPVLRELRKQIVDKRKSAEVREYLVGQRQVVLTVGC